MGYHEQLLVGGISMADPEGPIAWEESLDKALQRSREENKPVMGYFYRDG
jgi:hypothetical protein